MSWLSNIVLPKIRAVVAPREIPENLWDKCPSCDRMLFHRELEANLQVCHYCGFHFRLPASDRLRLLFDEGVFERVDLPRTLTDPLKFRDLKRYGDRLREAQTRLGPGSDALIVAHGEVTGCPTVVACFDFAFMGGSMGLAVGEGLVRAARLAVERRAALVAVPASGGARMQEGILSLMQMPRSVIAVEEVKEAGLPYLVLLTDPTTGGVSASFAMLGDVALAEPGAVIGFAGSRVIEETIRETLPDGFQRAEYLREHGMIDLVVPRRELRQTIGRIIRLLTEGAVFPHPAATAEETKPVPAVDESELANVMPLEPPLVAEPPPLPDVAEMSEPAAESPVDSGVLRSHR